MAEYGSAAHIHSELDIELGDVFTASATTQGLTKSGAEMSLRVGFIRRVYLLLAAQLCLTTLICFGAMAPAVAPAVVKRAGVISCVAGVVSFVLLLAMRCYKARHPYNLALLGAWTLAISLSLAVQCSVYAQSGDRDIVVQAAGTTLALFVSLTAFTFYSKIDFSFLRAGLFICLLGLCVWSLGSFFCGYPPRTMLYCVASAVVFCGYVLFDTHQLVHRLSLDQHVQGAIELYLDIINLFLATLRILKQLKSDSRK